MKKIHQKQSRAVSAASLRKQKRRQKRAPLPPQDLNQALEDALVNTPGLAAGLLQMHASSQSDSEKTSELTSEGMHEMLVPGSTRKPRT